MKASIFSLIDRHVVMKFAEVRNLKLNKFIRSWIWQDLRVFFINIDWRLDNSTVYLYLFQSRFLYNFSNQLLTYQSSKFQNRTQIDFKRTYEMRNNIEYVFRISKWNEFKTTTTKLIQTLLKSIFAKNNAWIKHLMKIFEFDVINRQNLRRIKNWIVSKTFSKIVVKFYETMNDFMTCH